MTTKIAVVGTYSSGKTTLVEGLMGHFPGMVLIPEHARRVITSGGLGLIRDVAVRDFLLVANLLDEAEIDEAGAVTVAISDSGLINNLAHERLFLTPAPSRTHILEAFRHAPYDVVFCCDPADVALVDDGQRILDRALRESLHTEVGSVLRAWGVIPIMMGGSPSDRLSLATQVINDLLHDRSSGPTN